MDATFLGISMNFLIDPKGCTLHRVHRVRKRRDAGSDDFEGLLEFQEALNVGWKLFLGVEGRIYVGRMGFRWLKAS